MRSPMFARFDRQAVYYREPPARRLAVILSLLFLLSLAAVAAITTARADTGPQAPTRVAVAEITSPAAQ